MIEVLALGFIKRALLAGIMTSVVAGYYGTFIVQRGMSFLGNGLAHAAFGGVALALLLGREPLYIAIPFTVSVALLITYVRNRTGLAPDTVIGIFFALSMALGIVFLSRIPTYTTDAFAYLFGSILSVTATDVWAAVLLVVLALISIPLWSRWAYASFDHESALADRLNVNAHDYILCVLIAVTIVVSAKVIGIVLISAFLVVPAAAARLVSRRFLSMTVWSMIFGAISVLIGLMLSYEVDTPSGATIILVQTAVFVVCFAFAALTKRRRPVMR